MESKFKKLTRREPRWLVSFADLMALLLALFVMLLSFAEVDSDSFKQNAGPISEAFYQAPLILAPQDSTSTKTLSLADGDKLMFFENKEDTLTQDQAKLRLMVVLSEEIGRKAIKVLEVDERIVIRFNDSAAFSSSSRELTPAIIPALEKIAEVLANTKGTIRVEGHTDDIAINTNMYRSNWDLSAARAATVVHYLLGPKRIKPSRISAMGLADSQPLVPNSSSQNQAVNRRVEITLGVDNPDSRASRSVIQRFQ